MQIESCIIHIYVTYGSLNSMCTHFSLQMGAFDSPVSCGSSVRPNTLQIKPHIVEENNNMLDVPNMMPTGPTPKRNKKRRPAKTEVKKFDGKLE